MTHNELSKYLARPPGMPKSPCQGELEVSEIRNDASQEGEGPPGTEVAVELHQCSLCGQTLVVRWNGDRPRLTNAWSKPKRQTQEV